MGIEVRYEATDGGGFKLRLMEGEEAVARLAVGRYTMQVAGVGVMMGGIADVVAHPAQRGKGYGAQLLRAAVARMRDERYPLSLLFGITDFYHRFGYAPVLAEYALTISTRHAERFLGEAHADTAHVRAGATEDAPALLELYTRVNSTRSGTLRRAAEKLDPTPKRDVENWWTHARRILLAEEGGRPAGYAVLSGNPAQFRVTEVVVPAEHVARAGVALVAALTHEAVERRLESMRLPLPPDEPLALLLQQAGCKVEVTYPANGDGMGRIVDLAALIDTIQPSLAARAARLPVGERPGRLELICEGNAEEPGQRVDVALSSSTTDRAIKLALPQQQLCQLVMGYRRIDAIRWQKPGACAEADMVALRQLFPEGYPHMWGLDHF